MLQGSEPRVAVAGSEILLGFVFTWFGVEKEQGVSKLDNQNAGSHIRED